MAKKLSKSKFGKVAMDMDKFTNGLVIKAEDATALEGFAISNARKTCGRLSYGCPPITS